MASVVKTETQAASSSTVSMILSLRFRSAFIRASWASRAAPVSGTEDTMRSGVVTALIVVFEEIVCPEYKEASLQVGSAQAGLPGYDYIEASRLSSSVIVMPT